MKRISRIVITFLLIFLFSPLNVKAESEKIKLKSPDTKQNLVSIIEARISKRDFKSSPLTDSQVSLILWSAAGEKLDAVSGATKTIPSAGATYPLELYLVVGKDSIGTIKQGVYHYIAGEHALEVISSVDKRDELAAVCLAQGFIADAPVSIIIAAEYSRTTARYGNRGVRYVHMEVGHAAQNIYLVVGELNLATVEVGAFHDAKLKGILGIRNNFEPLIVMPIGYSE